MHMYLKRNGTEVEYKIVTDPKEAVMWSTHRLKKSEIKIMTQCDKATAASIRQEILDDILSREPNPSRKSSSSEDKISQRREAPKPQHAKTRQTKQKTRRQDNR